MAQLIQHKRGRLERLSIITGSLQKGEILIVTGSSNITSSNGSHGHRSSPSQPMH